MRAAKAQINAAASRIPIPVLHRAQLLPGPDGDFACSRPVRAFTRYYSNTRQKQGAIRRGEPSFLYRVVGSRCVYLLINGSCHLGWREGTTSPLCCVLFESCIASLSSPSFRIDK